MDRNAFQLSASQNQVVIRTKKNRLVTQQQNSLMLVKKYLWAIVEQQQQVQRLQLRQPRRKEEVVLLRWGDDDNDDYQAVHITLNDDCNGDDDQGNLLQCNRVVLVLHCITYICLLAAVTVDYMKDLRPPPEIVCLWLSTGRIVSVEHKFLGKFLKCSKYISFPGKMCNKAAIKLIRVKFDMNPLKIETALAVTSIWLQVLFAQQQQQTGI
uniref:Uncharacterized protein n=1 Tax=Glossina pallidipes TaxID=7398 RepID=A0A1A9ZJD9_GLOPL